MRLACERFLTGSLNVNELFFYSDLGELRGVFGAYLDDLARLYGFEVAPPLLWILPSTSAENVPQGFDRSHGEISTTLYVMPPELQSSQPSDEERE
jgi:hypothetical protein